MPEAHVAADSVEVIISDGLARRYAGASVYSLIQTQLRLDADELGHLLDEIAEEHGVRFVCPQGPSYLSCLMASDMPLRFVIDELVAVD